MKYFLLLLGMTAMTSSGADPAALTFQSLPERTTLLELYTSDGCSSCPPAEKWLSQLKKAPNLWKEFVPMAFHVDYWDYLGWRDPWADAVNSSRQRAYAQQWRSESIYTPEFILNGHDWRDWSRGTSIPNASTAKAGILKIMSSDTNEWKVAFVSATAGRDPYEVHAVLLVSDLVSDVKAGENRGRHLDHDFVVRRIVSATLTRDGDSQKGTFTLPIPMTERRGAIALGAWISRVGDLEPLQAAGGWIIPPTRGE